jgi:Cu-processing system permease protein
MSRNILHPIRILASATFRELIRERLLYGVLVVSALLTGSSFFLATISLDQNTRIIQNSGVAAIHYLTLFITVFVATTNLHRDFDRRALYFLFPKPISRAQYILGKFLGYCYLLLTVLLILGGLFAIALAVLAPAVIPVLLVNLLFSFLELSLLISIAVMLASFTAPLNAALYTLALFVIGNAQSSIKEFAARSGNNFLEGITSAVYYILPNLEKFNFRQATLYEVQIPASGIAWALFYWLVFGFLSLFLATRIMDKHEL